MYRAPSVRGLPACVCTYLSIYLSAMAKAARQHKLSKVLLYLRLRLYATSRSGSLHLTELEFSSHYALGTFSGESRVWQNRDRRAKVKATICTCVPALRAQEPSEMCVTLWTWRGRQGALAHGSRTRNTVCARVWPACSNRARFHSHCAFNV